MTNRTISRVAAYAAAAGASALPLVALADNYCAPGQFCNPIEADSIVELLAMVLKFFVRVATVVCVLFLIWSGFLFVKAQGNEEELNKAKRAFFYAVIGTVLMLGAEVIAQAIAKTVKDIG
jgi:hypothetical protein